MASKSILIITNHFFPENFRINDVAFELASRGYKITVLTGIPNYPGGKFYKGYGILKKTNEIVNNVRVLRVPLIPRGRGSSTRLMLNYVSYLLFLSFWCLFVGIKYDFRHILVHHTSPIFLGIPAVVLKKMKKAQLLFWNLDLWPESLTAAGNIKNKYFLFLINIIVKFIYNNSDKILISSKGFEKSIINKNINTNKLIYFPNWAEDYYLKEIDNENLLVEKKPNQFSIMFAGNIGEAQDIESIFKAILALQEIDVSWIFLGDGRKLPWLKMKVEQHSLQSKVQLQGYKTPEYMPAYFRIADLMLLSLKDEYIFSITVPAKLQAYMSSKKMILGMLNGEGARIIEEAKCGLTCNSGDYNKLIQHVLTAHNMDVREREVLGMNGYNYYMQKFSKENTLNKLESLLG